MLGFVIVIVALVGALLVLGWQLHAAIARNLRSQSTLTKLQRRVWWLELELTNQRELTQANTARAEQLRASPMIVQWPIGEDGKTDQEATEPWIVHLPH